MKSRKFLRWGYNTLVVILLLTGIYFVVAHFVHFGNSEITDNATIYRHITPVNTRVQGFIREIRFDDYQEVHKGDTLVVIDDSEFCLRLGQTDAAIRLAKAQVDMARLNLSYTVIVATADGVVGRKDIHVGQLVQPGQTLVSLVDKADVWVVANYRETQLPNIKIGAPVEVKVDAVPDRVFEGTVERISDATGAASSLIPQDNATGNFVKVEQRVPVRIRLKASKDLEMLRAGLNVETSVAY